MVDTNKILTVSYGTFSCTLEGFDDSFETMKAIAEYFRELTADDRYFGAEPPQPDPEMLARIAQRGIGRHVEAHEASGTYIVRATDTPVAAALSAAASADLQSAIESGTSEAEINDIADKLKRIRDVVSRNEAEKAGSGELDDVFADDFVSSAAEDLTAALKIDDEIEADKAVFDDEVSRAVDRLEEAASQTDASTEQVEVGGLADDPAPEESLAEEQAAAEAAAAEIDYAVAATDHAVQAAEDDAPDVEDVEALETLADVDEPYLASEDEELQDAYPEAEVRDTAEDQDTGQNIDAVEDAGSDVADDLEPMHDTATEEDEAAIDVAIGIADTYTMEDVEFADDTPEPEITNVTEDTGYAEAIHSTYNLDASQSVNDPEVGDVNGDADPDAGKLEDAADQDPAPHGLMGDALGANPDADLRGDMEVADRATGKDELSIDKVLSDDIDEETIDKAFRTMMTAIPDDAEYEDYDDAGNISTLPVNFRSVPEIEDTPPSETDQSANEEMEEAPVAGPLLLKVKRSDLDAAIAAGDVEDVRETADGDDDEMRDDETAQDQFDDEIDDDETASLRKKLAQVEAELNIGLNSAEGTDTDDGAENGSYRDFSRLMAAAEEKMGDPESSSSREVYEQLRAAVAAAEAEKSVGGHMSADHEDEAYREDLASVVHPRRPETDGMAKTDRQTESRPAPLKLVAEQRVDTDGDADDLDPIRPRRIATSEIDEAGELEGGFAKFASDMGAKELPELLEAAASYMSFVEGRDQFSRPQLMNKVRQADIEGFNREDGLRSFGQLLREGKIEKKGGGRFSASGEIGYRPGERAAG